MTDYRDDEVMRAIMKGMALFPLPEDATFDDLERTAKLLNDYVKTAFPGVTHEQWDRCSDAIDSMEASAHAEAQAPMRHAIAEALEEAGAENLMELFSGEHDEVAQGLYDKLAAIPSAAKH